MCEGCKNETSEKCEKPVGGTPKLTRDEVMKEDPRSGIPRGL